MVRIRESTAQELFGFFAHDLRLGDCVSGMSQLPESCIDITVTSPPYNLGVKYGKYSDKEDCETCLFCKMSFTGSNRLRSRIAKERFVRTAISNPLTRSDF